MKKMISKLFSFAMFCLMGLGLGYMIAEFLTGA
jgi:hypothetical protein